MVINCSNFLKLHTTKFRMWKTILNIFFTNNSEFIQWHRHWGEGDINCKKVLILRHWRISKSHTKEQASLINHFFLLRTSHMLITTSTILTTINSFYVPDPSLCLRRFLIIIKRNPTNCTVVFAPAEISNLDKTLPKFRFPAAIN